MEYGSKLHNVFSFISGLPQVNDKPIKQALYNSIGLLALFLCCGAVYALYVILGPFIKPLMWALLVGSVLHPFKCSLAKRFSSWFATMEEARTPIFIGIFFVPVNIINDVSEFIGSKVLIYIKYIVAIAIAMPLLHVIYYYTPRLFICITWKLTSYSHSLISFIINNSTLTSISLILFGYLSLMVVLWTPRNNKYFHYVSIGVWLLLSCFLAHQFGTSFQTPIFLAMQIIFLAGFMYEVYDIHAEMVAQGRDVSIVASLMCAFKDQYTLNTTAQDQEISNSSGTSLRSEERDEKNEAASVQFSPSELVDANIEKIESIRTTPKKKDPWSLDLFEKPETDEQIDEKFSDNLEKKTSQNVRKSSLRGNTRDDMISILKSPSAMPVTSSEIFPKVLRHDSKVTKFGRSYSQPHVSSMGVSETFFRLKGKASVKSQTYLNTPIEYASDFYLYTLLWGCVIMTFWKNIMLFPILVIPILIYILKHVGCYLGLWNWAFGHWIKLLDGLNSWIIARYDGLIPVPIRGVFKVVQKVNANVKRNIKESIDTVSSCLVILGLSIFVICASVFITIQIYTETIMLVHMTSNIINQTVVYNPELRQMLPPTFDTTVDTVLDNAYQYGRQGLSNLVRGMMSDIDSTKSARLEKQVLELWDRLYQTWMSSDTSDGPKVTRMAVQDSWNSFVDDIQKSPEINIQSVTDFVKQNIDTFVTLMDSVWGLLKGNINLVISLLSTCISLLFGGGTAVLNFILNVIVFLTTLFYLLSSSGDLYKPVELMTNISPSHSRFGLALEAAVNGVFTASFKMAAFYGMWTWLIHNWFSVQIVYLPSALAAILGALPFLGTYWACVPAVLDLWLAQGKSFQAIIFAICQFLPTSIVDTIIYNEIQGGGHPYLTGLAIAGGIFCLGAEGAIIGPLLLCAIYVAIDLSSTLFKESPSVESLHSLRQEKNI